MERSVIKPLGFTKDRADSATAFPGMLNITRVPITPARPKNEKDICFMVGYFVGGSL